VPFKNLGSIPPAHPFTAVSAAPVQSRAQQRCAWLLDQMHSIRIGLGAGVQRLCPVVLDLEQA
jgi:hypothetical protein